ncbi:MAG: rhodanese-like domain-containing protein [Candidatus Moranbacteria bacterium]|nr:rhodanese-like domain-containing protein [Candidatus Moranbacteria bacterium]
MKNKKDTKAFLIGLAMIILVILITVVRGFISSIKEEIPSSQTSNETGLTSGQKYQSISSSELKQKISLGTNLNLLDIRSFGEYSNEHILDSVNVPIEELPVGSKIKVENPVVIITKDSTQREDIETVLKSLQDEHIIQIMVLAGGINAWKDIVGSTVKYGDPKSFTDQSKVSYVESDKLNDAIKKNVSTFILDVRTPQEYSAGHIKGAYNIPFDNLEKRRNEIKSFPKIVVAGINELQEFQASVQLYDMILIQPFVLKGGMNEWQKKSFELTK